MFERFTRDARVAVMLAQEEARDLNARVIGPEHVLLGVLQSADDALGAVLDGFGLTAEGVRARLKADDSGFDDEAEALRAIGIDLHAVRDAVNASFGPDAFDDALQRSGRRRRRRGHLSFSRDAKKVLEIALREALAHKGREIRAEHLVLALLRGGDRATVGLIAEHVYPAQLRAAVAALLDQAA
ncbi:Clp protease N-terminal domain-containing protein [Mycolicibacterium confluentis]|uniref:Clp protease n=1 Tax=Mycolicibacterium confluentis TaxID=28047 RepID=A0A7I7Y2L4_9MYCO|nr:Clp protease N-terminal domain-containing protein [Mycolicibacterium confluentis]MCV7320345.1 Clp protease [Mycolicibacterium confluentis]ORV21925.1 Clp protease [Mycolicibacterium confluentis]BBZ35383.1 Clp protease [Mycolicibacterium confluentis]